MSKVLLVESSYNYINELFLLIMAILFNTFFVGKYSKRYELKLSKILYFAYRNLIFGGRAFPLSEDGDARHIKCFDT